MKNPLIILSSGFWLSYIAVLIILLAMNSNIKLHNQHSSLRFAIIQAFMFVGLLPISILIFNQFYIISLVANSIAIPLLGSVILPVLFFGLLLFSFNVSLSDDVFKLGMLLLDILWICLEKLSELPGSYWTLPHPGYLPVSLAGIGMMVLILTSITNLKFMALCMLLPLFFAPRKFNS